jgi:hypothetical protein
MAKVASEYAWLGLRGGFYFNLRFRPTSARLSRDSTQAERFGSLPALRGNRHLHSISFLRRGGMLRLVEKLQQSRAAI